MLPCSRLAIWLRWWYMCLYLPLPVLIFAGWNFDFFPFVLCIDPTLSKTVRVRLVE